jgi:hypothetical protein
MIEAGTMWEICVRYGNGDEQVLKTYRSREVALRQIDALYAHGYPLHVAYIVRSAKSLECSKTGYSSDQGWSRLELAY